MSISKKNIVGENMKEQLKVQEILRQKFLEFKQINPSFSVRAFAKILNMQPSATNEIMKGERKVSVKLAKKIAEKLLLGPQESAELLDQFNRKSDHKEDQINQTELLQRHADNFEFISNWIHQAILLAIKYNQGMSIARLENIFGISKDSLKKVIGRLEKMGLITTNDSQTFYLSENLIDQNIYLNQIALKNLHLKDLELIKDKIQFAENKQTIFENQIFLMNESNLTRAREIIQKTHLELKNLEDNMGSGHIFKISTYVYPLSNLTIS